MALAKNEILQAEFNQTMLALLKRIQWSEQGKKYDTGDYAEICPVCRQTKTVGHDAACELWQVILVLEQF